MNAFFKQNKSIFESFLYFQHTREINLNLREEFDLYCFTGRVIF